MEWINIKNKLPGYQWILTIDNDWFETTGILGTSIDITFFDPKNDVIDFIYWMPIPKEPKP